MRRRFPVYCTFFPVFPSTHKYVFVPPPPPDETWRALKATVAPAPTTSQIVWGPQNRKLGKQDHATRKADFPQGRRRRGGGGGRRKGGKGAISTRGNGRKEGESGKGGGEPDGRTDGRGEGRVAKGTTNTTPVNWEQEHISYTNNSQTSNICSEEIRASATAL